MENFLSTLRGASTLDHVVSSVGTLDPSPFSTRYRYRSSYGGDKDVLDMTLIAAAWSPEGFAIASDGLRIETASAARIENARKIFHTSFRNNTGFAYAWCGATRFCFQSGNYFDFVESTKHVTQELFQSAFPPDPADYFREFGQRMFSELPRDVGLSNQCDSKVLFVGYGNSSPLWVELEFPHSDDAFLPPIVSEPEYSPRYFKAFSGSAVVLNQMQIDGALSQPLNIQEALELVYAYANRCVESNETIRDCANFGGLIRVASVTIEGFSWATID